MKPFAFVADSKLQPGYEFFVHVADTLISWRWAHADLAQKSADKINAAFESRLKEEMENFRERSIKRIRDERVNEKETGQEADRAYNLALDHAIDAVNALPLFE